jgi:hypothetical protein
MMQKRFFQKQSIGFAALASARDWAIVIGMILGILALREAALLRSLMDKDLLRSVFIGACAGMDALGLESRHAQAAGEWTVAGVHAVLLLSRFEAMELRSGHG